MFSFSEEIEQTMFMYNVDYIANVYIINLPKKAVNNIIEKNLCF